MRLFLDANIIFSAAYRDGSPADSLFQLARAGRCELLSSAFAIGEARRNITAKKADRIAAVERLVRALRLVPEAAPAQHEEAAKLGVPAKDAPILAAALACRADVLVTGDRAHFGHLYGKKIGALTILTLAVAAERILR